MKRLLIVLAVISAAAFLYIARPKQVSLSTAMVPMAAPTERPVTQTPTLKPIPTASPSPTLAPKTRVLIENVPFASQAPFAEWKDERFQDGCEEAAALLAVYWAKGLTLDKIKAKEEILAMSAFQTEKYQEFRDTSVEDSAERLIKGYFKYDNFEVKNDISLTDIKNELTKGNLVIVPANGQALNNPHFTAPGPERHNIVVRGFDDQKGIFITNDPGIKEGELYQYPQDVLFKAIRDYPTGYHQPITETKKVMIVIKKV